MRYRLAAVSTAVACVMFPAAAAGKSGAPASSATRCNGSYCVTGGTTTVSLSPGWLRRLTAAGIRLEAIAPARRSGGTLSFPISPSSGGRYGDAGFRSRSSWYVEGCDVFRGGALFHAGGAVIASSSARHKVNALVDGPHFALEFPMPSIWKTGHPPKPVTLAFSFASWNVRSIAPGGFTAEAQLAVSGGRTKGLGGVPPGPAGTLRLDVRVTPAIAGTRTAASCVSGPSSTLPRGGGGSLYPLLGVVPYGSPLQNLYGALGRGNRCVEACRWEQGPDSFEPLVVPPVDGREGVQVRFRELLVHSTDPRRSALKRWRTPEGIHIGSTRAELRRAYPGVRIGCASGDCLAGVDTRLYTVTAGSRRTRQRFQVNFGFEETGPAASYVSTLRVFLLGEEGSCWVSWRHEGDYMEFDANCFGPLVSARFEPVGDSPRFARQLQAGGTIRAALDDDGRAHPVPGGVPFIRGSTGAGGAEWAIECDRGSTITCPPGRGAGTAAWPAGAFEEWEVQFRGYSAAPAPPKEPGAGPKIPPMRFVAQFLGMPRYEITISRSY